MLGKIGEDAPVVDFVGVGQRGPRHTAANADMVEFVAQRAQTGFDVAQAVTVSQLCECHCQILVPAGEASLSCISVVTRQATAKLAVGKKADQLRKRWFGLGSPIIVAPTPNLRSWLCAVQIAASQNRAQLSAGKGVPGTDHVVNRTVVTQSLQCIRCESCTRREPVMSGQAAPAMADFVPLSQLQMEIRDRVWT
jgi:hypothetical protein